MIKELTRLHSPLEAKSFVKWAGGKRALVDSIISYMPKSFNNYFEPFVGGGALFFALKTKGFLDSKKIYLSDKNSELINAYQVIQNNPKAPLKELKSLQKITIQSFFIVFATLIEMRILRVWIPY